MSAVASTTTGVSVVCRMGELLTAVAAVVPHVGREKDGGGVERVRVVVDTSVMRLALLAANEASAVVAMLPLEDADEPVDGQGRPVTWVEADLSAEALRTVVAVLRGGGGDSARVSLQHALEEGRATALQVTDVTGMLPGRSVRVRALGSWGGDGQERVDAASVVLEACAADLAATGAVVLSAERMRPWMATGRALGVLPLRVTTTGQLVLVAGAATEDLAGLAVVGCGLVSQVPGPGTGQPAYDGPAVSALMGLLLDGVPVGGEPVRDAASKVVTELEDWLATRTTAGEDGTGDGDAPEGGDAA
ncbi:hypothetical protein D5R93_05845 [Actinomyces lilanjuaniae]|uniref:Uncharacterized protein n=1 Tax=Actinomyces lilanjuaniae TaxID=2321394 RepID=A0ABM6Z361_9ACTO|nr:hypothetical protein [Actinomyces lilanjuaniae]AYD89691.1 hypothetical protein D5R93_05845 [Actinomyces lilanjuaniae]